MLTGTLLLVVFAAAIALLLLLIIRFDVNPFLALLITAVGTAAAVGMPLESVGDTVTKGFGNTLAGIGIVIGLGILLGNLLVEAGAADEIAARMLAATGPRHAPLAVGATGYMLSIPVFIDAAFVIVLPLVARIARKTGRPWITYVTALSVGLIVTHTMVIPTPGPVAVAGNMGLDVGLFLLYGIVASLVGALVGGWGYGLFLERRMGHSVTGPAGVMADEPAPAGPRAAPSAGRAFGVLLLPVVLILAGSILRLVLPAGAWYTSAVAFVGDKNIALLIGVVVAVFALRPYLRKPVHEIVAAAAAAAGMILLITGAGGAFGHVISASGIGQYLVDTMTSWNVSLLVLGFLLSALLRAAQGSATVALVTTSAILGPTAAAAGASPLLVGLAVCAGGMCASLPNDSAFWVVSRFAGLSVRDTLRSWTVGSTLAGLVAFLVILLLQLLAPVLPGLGF